MSPRSLQRQARMKPAATRQNGRREYRKTGHYKRINTTKHKGFAAINGQTWAGREAKRWGAWAIKQKGGSSCNVDIEHEIQRATFDKWLELELVAEIIDDARKRGSVLNRRKKELPRMHEQHNTVSMRFDRRREGLQLDKGGLDIALRFKREAMMRENGGER